MGALASIPRESDWSATRVQNGLAASQPARPRSIASLGFHLLPELAVDERWHAWDREGNSSSLWRVDNAFLNEPLSYRA